MKHPIQPIDRVGGQWRFRPNPVVQYLLDHGPDLSTIRSMPSWDPDAMEHLYQLLGTTIDGYFETFPKEISGYASQIERRIRELEEKSPLLRQAYHWCRWGGRTKERSGQQLCFLCTVRDHRTRPPEGSVRVLKYINATRSWSGRVWLLKEDLIREATEEELTGLWSSGVQRCTEDEDAE